MPFRISRHRRLKIIACLLGAAQLIGCATTEQTATAPGLETDQAASELAELFEGMGDEPASQDQQAAESAPAAPISEQQPKDVIEEAIDESVDPLDQIAASAPQPVLPTPQGAANIQVFDWRVIGSAPVGNFFTGVAHHDFIRPVAIAVQSEYLYVVDDGADILYRFDLASRRLEALLDLKAEMKGEVADVYVDKDFSFYLTDTEAGRVVHYDRHGRVLQVFRDHFNLVRPVAVTRLENGDVVIADGHYDHLLQFNSMGKLVAAHGGRGTGVAEFINIMTMAEGPDGYYVGARVGRRLQVLGRDGNYLYAFEEGTVVFPAAIAVDRNNRSYVADYMDNTIKVFDRGSLIGTIGRFGTGAGQFKRITDLWLDGNRLYIVDSLNQRIQVAQLAPDAAPVPGAMFDPETEPLQESVPETQAPPSSGSVDAMREEPVPGPPSDSVPQATEQSAADSPPDSSGQ